MIKVVLCGYREWAIEIIQSIKSNTKVIILETFTSQDDFLKNLNLLQKDLDCILFFGWSWIIPPEITENHLCLGIHPSDLPNYRGGSPIQHQIIAGIKKTKLTLMTLSSKKLDAGEIWLKEDLDLTGKNISEIFVEITRSSIKLLDEFFCKYPNISPTNQDLSQGSYYKRRHPDESKMQFDDFKSKSLLELYNFIRCLTDPYPNAFIEDSDGNRLIFKQVEYVESQIRINEEN
jgi:methionyl-tRNA formyltransferase